jgi:hypothetical protein
MAGNVYKFNYCFESYGVKVAIESNSADVLEQASSTARSALLGNLLEIDRPHAEQVFRLPIMPDGVCIIYQDGELMAEGKLNPGYWKYFDSLVRILVAEFARDKVFIHAGSVGWRGRAIILPGNSHFGKTTLVAELARCGAEYYSDEYAIIDDNGLVHPFARKLTMRENGRHIIEKPFDVEEFGGKKGSSPIPVSAVVFTKYDPESNPEYAFLTTGQGIVEVIGQTIGIRRNSEFVIKVLKKAFSNAIILKSSRNEAAKFARELLEFVDNTAI